MSVIRLPIDIKSFYFNIKNDNKRGHTAMVATPLKQGTSVRKDLARIVEIPENIKHLSREGVVSDLIKRSRALVKINGVYVFDKISVNGKLIQTTCAFCLYVREEISRENVHFGRQKIHYPISLKYEDVDICINNKAIMKSVSSYLHNYAFLVEAFEYDTKTKILNFEIIIVGENNIPYSKVFINRRGMGNKFVPYFSDFTEIYDTEIISLRDRYGYEVVTPENFNDFVAQNEEKALALVTDYLTKIGMCYIRILREEYPYSIYDIQCTKNNKKKYVVVRQTATKSKYFALSMAKIKFFNAFSEDVSLALVIDINNNPQIFLYTIEDLNDLNKSINSITYRDGK